MIIVNCLGWEARLGAGEMDIVDCVIRVVVAWLEDQIKRIITEFADSPRPEPHIEASAGLDKLKNTTAAGVTANVTLNIELLLFKLANRQPAWPSKMGSHASG